MKIHGGGEKFSTRARRNKKKKIQTFCYFSEALGYINDFSAPPPYIFSY